MTHGTQYLLARASTDGRLDGLLLDLARCSDGGHCQSIQKSITDYAWHRGVNEFDSDDAHTAARTIYRQMRLADLRARLLRELEDVTDPAIREDIIADYSAERAEVSR